MNVRDIMSRSVVWASPATHLRDIWRKVFSAHVNAIPVVDTKKKLLGIISKEDFLQHMYPDYQEYFEDLGSIRDFAEMENKVKELGDKKVAEIMCKRVIFTHPDTPVMRALSRMIVRRVNQLPVVDEDGVVLGMITKGDIFYALVKKGAKRPLKRKNN